MKLNLSHPEQINARAMALAHAADLAKNAMNYDPARTVADAERFYAFLTDDGTEPVKAEAPRTDAPIESRIKVHFVPSARWTAGGALIREDTMVETLRMVGYSVHDARPPR